MKKTAALIVLFMGTVAFAQTIPSYQEAGAMALGNSAGNASIEIAKEGEDIEINFNPKLFIDALKAIDDETVTIYLLGKKFPCFIRKEDTYNYVILPILG